MADKKEEIILSICGMSKSFGRNRVLDHINFRCEKRNGYGTDGRKWCW